MRRSRRYFASDVARERRTREEVHRPRGNGLQGSVRRRRRLVRRQRSRRALCRARLPRCFHHLGAATNSSRDSMVCGRPSSTGSPLGRAITTRSGRFSRLAMIALSSSGASMDTAGTRKPRWRRKARASISCVTARSRALSTTRTEPKPSKRWVWRGETLRSLPESQSRRCRIARSGRRDRMFGDGRLIGALSLARQRPGVGDPASDPSFELALGPQPVRVNP